MMNPRSSFVVAAIAALISTAGLATAQPEKPVPVPQPAVQPPTQPESQPKAPPAREPTLDEMLGLPNAKPAEKPPDSGDASKPEPVDPAKAELDRQLSAGEIAEAFEQAVALMGQTADRLSTAHDSGLDTQRMQEDVIRKLDTLIDQAKKQQSSSKSKSKKDQQQQQQQQQSSQQNSQQSSKTNDPQKGGGPPKAEGAVHAAPGATAAWGSLPPNERAALIEGTSEHYSSLYRSITEKYYKRLAEEPKNGGSVLAPVTHTTPPSPTTLPPAPTPPASPDKKP